jgi:hypothetical protein
VPPCRPPDSPKLDATAAPSDKQPCRKIADYLHKQIARTVSVSERWRP